MHQCSLTSRHCVFVSLVLAAKRTHVASQGTVLVTLICISLGRLGQLRACVVKAVHAAHCLPVISHDSVCVCVSQVLCARRTHVASKVTFGQMAYVALVVGANTRGTMAGTSGMPSGTTLCPSPDRSQDSCLTMQRTEPCACNVLRHFKRPGDRAVRHY